ncbi:hypothetical protein [Ferrovum myxofaciens]
MLEEKFITAENIARRKEFLEFSEVDVEILSQIHQYLERNEVVVDLFTDSFY